MKTFNILFTSSGRRVSLISHFKNVLKELQLEGVIVTADLKPNSPAAFVSDYHELVPRVLDDAYIPSLKKICKKYNINLLIPLIDTELYVLSIYKEEFEELGVTVLVSSPEINEICYDKRKTGQFFVDNGFDTPKEYVIEEIINDPNADYPYLIKPAKGSSSIGVYKIRNRNELLFFKDYIPDPILQEFVIGEEYTIDVLIDFNGKVVTAVPRLRIETRAGEVSKGMTVRNELLINTARKVVEKLSGAVGCITLQCFLTDKNEVKFIEINPRFGGGFPLSIAAGADFPRFIIESLLGMQPSINVDNWQDGLVMLRYDDAIFVNKDEIYND
ncbi:ATP-grasp domain-containing protein [Parageobacillus toebii]|uniref:ATP-grasp domain-containing protein n=1 Tax=Parageobacillus toebii TaxID=153151 RepID=UPI0035C70356